MTGLHAQRTALLLACMLPFQFAFSWASEPVLLALGQDPEVSRLASQYLRVLSFGYPGYAAFEVLRRWLQAQGLMTPPAVAIAIIAPVNILLQWLLVWGPGAIGFLGAPLATAISFTGMALVTALYCYLYAPRTCWAGFDKEALRNLGPNLKLGFAGVLAVSSEWWAFEALGLGASTSAYMVIDTLLDE
jgi:MATE family multidrug resistance protein